MHVIFIFVFVRLLALCSGKDTYDTLRKVGNNVENYRRQHETEEVWYVGGDMLFISTVLGLGGKFRGQGNSCPWCLVRNNELHMTKSFPLRDTKTIFHLSHSPYPGDKEQFPFTCPACEKHFKSANDVAGDKCKHKDKHMKTHFNVQHQQHPILNVPVSRHILCTLDLLLSITKTLFHEFIRCNVCSQDVCTHVNRLLDNLHICCKKLTPLTGSNVKACRPVTFSEPECIVVLENFNALLDAVHEGKRNSRWHQQ